MLFQPPNYFHFSFSLNVLLLKGAITEQYLRMARQGQERPAWPRRNGKLRLEENTVLGAAVGPETMIYPLVGPFLAA